MIRLATFVRAMIMDGKTAAVPGLGTFHVRHIPARIDEHKAGIMPPEREIIFEENRYLQHAGFIHELAQREGLSDESAFHQLAEYLNACYSQINKGKRIELTGVGLLYRDAAGQLVFEADKDLTEGGPYYGFRPVPLQIKPARSKKPAPTVTPAAPRKRKPVLFRLFLMLLLAGGVAITAYWGYIVYEMIRNPESAGPVHTFKPAGQTTPAAATKKVYKDTLPAFPPVKTAEQLVGIPEEIRDSIVENAAETVAGTETSRPETKPVESQVKKKETVEIQDDTNAGEATQKYYIIAGCFRSEDGAKRFVKELKAKGWAAELVGKTTSGLNMVSYTSFLNKSLAEQELKRIRLEENEGAYMVLR